MERKEERCKIGGKKHLQSDSRRLLIGGRLEVVKKIEVAEEPIVMYGN
jgi:hypothetical protein